MSEMAVGSYREWNSIMSIGRMGDLMSEAEERTFSKIETFERPHISK